MEHLPRLQSGIEGLDTLLKGGLVAGASYMIQGRPGSGKTILANQIAFHHAAQGGRVLFATLLSESHERLLQFLSTLRFFDRRRVGNEIQYVSAFDTLESEGLDEVVKLLRREIGRQKASVLVVDGVLNARSRAGSSLDTKKFIAELQGHAAFAGCTVLFLTSARLDDSSPEHTMVDGVIEMSEELTGVRASRRLHLRKTRGSGAVPGLHEMEITEAGIVVYPRLESLLGQSQAEIDPTRAPITSGVADLDAMVGGGLQQGSITLVIGPSGSGKTTLGLHFAAQATPEEPALIFGFYETEPRIRRKGGALGLPLAAKLDSGALHMAWQPTTERMLDPLGYRLLDEVKRSGARRVLIDSLGGMARASTNPQRHVEFFTALLQELRMMGVTAMATWEIRDLFDASAQAPALELSSLFDNLLVLRFTEVRSELRRVLSVVKVRDWPYEASLRELMITPTGLRLNRHFENVNTVHLGANAPQPGG
ncbi:serine/threonine protein kinase [Pseudoroseomonas deserti]|uniref:non-specific serine/threonine protein kinase n=1 Tax=Teichococcus deserti TaxID=1817963 RepID=A0A1V2GYZ7_9PROT|nr:ATPase domain-containing protein [Pseudoroseomonas deserti]ONG50087.1 serine/threonine protein kinase [Pseudoroseomonas deserti]